MNISGSEHYIISLLMLRLLLSKAQGRKEYFQMHVHVPGVLSGGFHLDISGNEHHIVIRVPGLLDSQAGQMRFKTTLSCQYFFTQSI